MAKRFTDTKKWNDDWYISLSNDNRIVWQWLLDNCNHAGLCKRSVGLLNLMCRTNITELELIEIMQNRVIIHNDYWFIPNFLKFQYGSLINNKAAILSAVKELFKQDCIRIIPESFGNDFRIISESYENHCIMIKDKDKDKDKEKNKLKTLTKDNTNIQDYSNIIGTKENISKLYPKGHPKIGESAVAFSEDSMFAIFEDGYKQEIGNNQQFYKHPNLIKRGLIN
jgi:hypothetical protein